MAWSHLADAQQPAKVPRIRFLAVADPDTPNILAFRRGLRDLGYIERKNILIEFRFTEGSLDRTPSLVAELVQLKIDLLVLVSVAAIRAAKESTQTIPIVMITTEDPVATRLVDSLARPGGNVTGLTGLTQELNGKRLELLKEVVPTISRVVAVQIDISPLRLRPFGCEVVFARFADFFRVDGSEWRALKLQIKAQDIADNLSAKVVGGGASLSSSMPSCQSSRRGKVSPASSTASRHFSCAIISIGRKKQLPRTWSG